jgi:hypothetical protein
MRRWDWLLWGLLVGCAAGVLIQLWEKPDTNQWDFRTYYYATRAFDEGLNPYQIGSLIETSGSPGTNLRYVYPLSVAYLMRPLAAMDYLSAYRIWLLLKLGALAALLFLWSRTFLRGIDRRVATVVILLGFDAALLWDFRTGNISVFEQLLLWTAFAFFVRRKWTAFAAFVVMASLFKLTPSVFLLMLCLPQVRTGGTVVTAFGSLCFLVIATLGPFAGHHTLFDAFLNSAGLSPGWLQSNQSFTGIATELVRRHNMSTTGWMTYLIGFGASIVVLLPGRRVIMDTFKRGSLDRIVLLACIMYALIMPRMMSYSYLILAVPFLAMVLPFARQLSSGPLILCILVCMTGVHLLPSDVGHVLARCETLLSAVLCWFVIVIGYQRTIANSGRHNVIEQVT